MKELGSSLPEGVEYKVTLDTTEVIDASIHEVLITFLETTLLVVLVIFLFLQNFRAVVIPFITIPVSLIGTLAVMAALGFSINTFDLIRLDSGDSGGGRRRHRGGRELHPAPRYREIYGPRGGIEGHG